MFFFLIDAALAVGGVLLLIQQYQTGFQGAKKVGAELVRGLYKMIGTPMPEAQVDEVVGSIGRHTEAVRREVAKVRAYHQQFIESAAANRTLAARYAHAVNVALSRQEERLARAAAHKKIAHVKTAALFDGFAAAIEKIMPTLEARLELTEDRHEAAKASAGILKAEISVATANEEVYRTLSGIESETGIPFGDKLEALRQQTRHEYLTSEHLLQLLPETPDAEIEAFMKGIDVDDGARRGPSAAVAPPSGDPNTAGSCRAKITRPHHAPLVISSSKQSQRAFAPCSGLQAMDYFAGTAVLAGLNMSPRMLIAPGRLPPPDPSPPTVMTRSGTNLWALLRAVVRISGCC